MYVPIAELYKQSMGIVYLARNRTTGERVVIKMIDRGASVTKNVQAELLLHRRCAGHPFIAQLKDVFLTSRHLAIVLEYFPAGDVLSYVNSRGGLPEEDARWLFQQLVVAMKFLHSLGATNREMKLDNKLLCFVTREETNDGDVDECGENGAARVVQNKSMDEVGSFSFLTTGRPILKMQDFSYSKSEQINSDPHSALGSLPYTAPEILSNSMKKGTSADVWALGVALFKIVTGLYPFERSEDAKDARGAVQSVLGRIARVDYSIPENLSPPLRDLLSRMLVRTPDDRIGMEDILGHPWVVSTMPDELKTVNEVLLSSDAASSPLTESSILQILEEARLNLNPLDSENVEELADEILNEEEADDLLEELALD
jgi:serine/threonine-protein kinase SRK2